MLPIASSPPINCLLFLILFILQSKTVASYRAWPSSVSQAVRFHKPDRSKCVFTFANSKQCHCHGYFDLVALVVVVDELSRHCPAHMTDDRCSCQTSCRPLPGVSHPTRSVVRSNESTDVQDYASSSRTASEDGGVEGNEETGTVGQPIDYCLSVSTVVVGASRGFVGLHVW